MELTRRIFLQRSGQVLAAWAVGEAALPRISDRYQAAIAAPTVRKLALLVGIDQYPGGSGLEGCTTDVDLQRELLIYRFGFQPGDILTLTNQQATRAAIATAFLEHLVNQARPGDVVVFHFSGYGSTLKSDPTAPVQTSLVTADPPVQTGDAPLGNQLQEETLWLLGRSLKTDQFTTILDTSYTDAGSVLQGNLRVRSLASSPMSQLAAAELLLQDQLLARLHLERSRLRVERQSGQFPGLLLAAAKPGQVATETRWNHFSAGLFTYGLTQSLWQAMPATRVRIALGQAAEQIKPLASQQHPQLTGQKSLEPSLVPYFMPEMAIAADAAIVTGEANATVQLWLGGLPAPLLEHYGVGSLGTVLPAEAPLDSPSHPSPVPVWVQIVTRDGLLATAKVLRATPDTATHSASVPLLQRGQCLQEWVRVLPRTIGLTVALDSSLDRIERVDTISALSAVPRLSAAIAGEQPADYLFSKLSAGSAPPLSPSPTASPPIPLPSSTPIATPAVHSGYGLFSAGRDSLPTTMGESGEAVKVAVRRLIPKLQTLLATKLLSLTVNERTSRLGIRATLELMAPQERPLLQRSTLRLLAPPISSPAAPLAAPTDGLQLPIGSRVRYRVENYGDRPVYPLLLALDSASNLMLLHAPAPVPTTPGTDSTHQSTESRLVPGSMLQLPNTGADAGWAFQQPAGLVESFLICSTTPFTQTLAALVAAQVTAGAIAAGTLPERTPLGKIANPVEVAQAILQDLHHPVGMGLAPPPDTVSLDVNTWATLRFPFQLV